MNTVTLLKDSRGNVLAVYSNVADAQGRADKFNSDPYMYEGEADPAAPYSVETFAVTERV